MKSDGIRMHSIDSYPWGGSYRPPVSAFIKKSASSYHLHMEAEELESNLRSLETDPLKVFQDSCLEFFFKPGHSPNYINFEINPSGVFLAAIGEARTNRAILPNAPTPSPFAKNPIWGFDLQIPFSFLKTHFPNFTPSLPLYGNFYICGDLTPFPHYGVWNPISTPRPDFHRPDFFRMLII
jgi:hypothetical protein